MHLDTVNTGANELMSGENNFLDNSSITSQFTDEDSIEEFNKINVYNDNKFNKDKIDNKKLSILPKKESMRESIKENNYFSKPSCLISNKEKKEPIRKSKEINHFSKPNCLISNVEKKEPLRELIKENNHFLKPTSLISSIDKKFKSIQSLNNKDNFFKESSTKPGTKKFSLHRQKSNKYTSSFNDNQKSINTTKKNSLISQDKKKPLPFILIEDDPEPQCSSFKLTENNELERKESKGSNIYDEYVRKNFYFKFIL
jgi:hypothetical protein